MPPPLRTCATTPKSSQVAPCRGEKAKGKAIGKGKEAPPPEEGEEKGDLLIQDLWTQGTDIIHDKSVMNTDAVSYQSKTPEKCLDTAECKKNRKYISTFLNESRRFTPFVASVV